MNLRKIMLIHVILTIPYSIAMIVAPTWFMGLFSDTALTPLGVEIARLFGALFIVMVWSEYATARLDDPVPHRLVASGVFVYLCVGFIASLISQLNGVWSVIGWLNPITYGIFAILYGIFWYIERPNQ